MDGHYSTTENVEIPKNSVLLNGWPSLGIVGYYYYFFHRVTIKTTTLSSRDRRDSWEAKVTWHQVILGRGIAAFLGWKVE